MTRCKNPLLLFVLLLCVCACTHAPKADTDLYLLNLQGKVKSVSQTTYHALPDSDVPVKGEPVQGQFDARFEQSFNKKGYTIQKEVLMPDGQIMTKSLTQFGSSDLPDKEEVYNGDGELILYTLYLYDEDDQLMTREIYDADQTLKEKFRMTYNDKGYLVKIVKELPHDLVVAITTIKNDDLGFPIDENTVSPAGNGISHIRFQRQADGKLLYMTTYGGGGQELSRTTYNAKGDEQIWEGDGREIAYDYQYDKVGNWTQKVIYENGHPEYIVERNYQYY